VTILIKRYPNRKLYDTARKEYITLDRIAELIKQGEDVQVLDNASGEDLTAVTLSQIVFELEKRWAGSYSKSLLAGLVQSGGETLDAVRRTLTAPLDLSRHVDEEIERRMDVLIAENEVTYEEGRKILEKLRSVGKRKSGSASVVEEMIGRLLEERGVPTWKELAALSNQIDALTKSIDELTEKKR
jgi:polyhydroxyalkanoate synthesis repressor PhaR